MWHLYQCGLLQGASSGTSSTVPDRFRDVVLRLEQSVQRLGEQRVKLFVSPPRLGKRKKDETSNQGATAATENVEVVTTTAAQSQKQQRTEKRSVPSVEVMPVPAAAEPTCAL